MNPNIKAVAIGRLVREHGWQADEVLKNMATTQFPTAVGLKQGSARIHQSSTGTFWMTGEYQSEGHNAFSTCYATIEPDSTLETVEAAVDAFANEAKWLVSQSYAGRLLALA